MNRFWILAGRIAFWLAWPALWVYLRDSKRSRLIITNEYGELLVVKGWLSANGRWDLPGGGLHTGEDVAVGACRELREETGLILRPEQLQVLGSRRVESKGFKTDLYFFSAQVTGRPELRRQPFEIIEARWLALKELNSTSADEQVLEALALVAQ